MSKQVISNPMKDLRGYMREDEIKKLLAAPGISERDKLILRVLWVSGCRISELVGDKSWYKERVFEGVKVADIDFNDKAIIMDTLKRKQYPPPKRRVSIDNITLTMLHKYVKDNGLAPEDKLFSITKRRVEQIICELGESVGIKKVGSKKIHPHHLRHSHCIAFIRKNNTLEGLRKLQTKLGHANINTTAHYLQFALEEQKETEDIFGKW